MKKIIKKWKIRKVDAVALLDDGNYIFTTVGSDETEWHGKTHTMDHLLANNSSLDDVYENLIQIRDGHLDPYWVLVAEKTKETNAEICNCDISVLMCIGCQCGGR